jgi:putative DNA primase/helicase
MNDDELYNPDGATLSTPQDIWKYDPCGSPPRIPMARQIATTDLMVTRIEGVPGYAERLEKVFGHCLRYCHERKKWLVWWPGGSCWRWDDSGSTALAMVAEVVHETYRQARFHGREKEERAALKMLLIREMKDVLIAAQHALRVPLVALDAHPDLLACQNGTVDLATGDLKRSLPEHLITKTVHCDYDPGADAPVFEAFLRTALKSDRQTIEAMRMYLGYSLTGLVSAKVSFLAVGAGDTGKSTLLGCFFKLLGDYAAKIAIETLMRGAEHSNNAQADLADLRGARFVVTSEVDKSHRLNVSRFKTICQGGGGLPLKATLKYENPMTFPETHKLWIDANHRPVVHTEEQEIFNRMIVIPFDNVLAREEQDDQLSDKLEAEFPGILAWAVRGAWRWYKSRELPRPPAIAKAGAAYRTAMDTVAQFIEDCCELDAVEITGSTALYNAFTRWAAQQHVLPVSQKKFSMTLKERGFAVNNGREISTVEGIRLL